MPISDSDLIRKAVHGDESAFREIVDRYANELYKLARVLSGSVTDAEDIVQETFSGAFKGLRRFESRSSLKTWLHRILVRQAARHKRLWKRERYISADRIEESPAPLRDADAKLDLDTMLESLSREHREALALRELEGFSYKEMAEILNVPIGTVESRLYRARSEVRKQFPDYFTEEQE